MSGQTDPRLNLFRPPGSPAPTCKKDAEGERTAKGKRSGGIGLGRKREMRGFAGGGKGQVEKVQNSGFGVRGHSNHWGAEGSKAKKTALGSEVKIGRERERERESEIYVKSLTKGM